MITEIITIGRELLDGSRVDTNTSYLGGKLTAAGATVVRSVSVPDEPGAIRRTVSSALASADLVITTGGLGPTCDDRTKQVIADIFGSALVLDEDVLERVRDHFESRNLRMPEINVSQAMVPDGARPIHNSRGTAPGLYLERDGAMLFVLPGVPAEMKGMVEHYVLPFLEGKGLRRAWAERVMKTTGIPESELAELIGDLARKLARTEIAYLPSRRGVDVRVISRDEDAGEAEKTVASAVVKLSEKIGDFVYSTGGESLEEVVGYLLAMKRKTLAVAESCTGGGLGARLTRVAGSSDYFVGGVVAYSNDLKKRLTGVKAGTLRAFGAVSAEAAVEMAEGVAAKAKTDYGAAITGIAGPGGGSEDKPVGLVYVAVSGGRRTVVRELRLAGGRETVRDRATQAALDTLRRVLMRLPRLP